jgi:hypothetical protein
MDTRSFGAEFRRLLGRTRPLFRALAHLLGLTRRDGFAPFRSKRGGRIGIALLEERSRYHAIGAEAAEVGPQLAPRDQHARDLRVADGHRPDRALRDRALLVLVLERDLLAGADRGAQRGHVDGVRPIHPARRRGDAGVEHERAQALGHHGSDLGAHVERGARQHRIAVARDPLRAEHDRFDLVRREHQGRQIEALLHHVADAGLAADRDALAEQARDVAVHGALRDLELGGDRVGGHGLLAAAQELDDLEEAVGAAHFGIEADFARVAGIAGLAGAHAPSMTKPC